jgi:hypothetical protein
MPAFTGAPAAGITLIPRAGTKKSADFELIPGIGF